MNKTLWKVIAESKAGEVVLDSGTQYKNLKNVLAKMDKKEVREAYDAWSKIRSEWYDSDEFNLLHAGNGGFVNGGDDGFYMDFASWLIAQGEELYNEFQKRGHQAVIEYVDKHQIGENDYRFECMVYAFHDYID
ncbi:DUF4240 domain-containing protein [Bacillus cereus]|uniref:DUF4240 domain-containing protein n=1 Tax=Bacillus cereus TaxID=1396 RepID=UPI000BFBFAA3|nr:DUF4240 domain-containing protein [Bacillus cereus]PGR83662.1 hypothetical protein COC63_06655 [Bacillus cereus]